MTLQSILSCLSDLTDGELARLASAADAELYERELAREGPRNRDPLGLIPLYRCPNQEHQRLGLWAEDPDAPGSLTCGCSLQKAQLAGYE